jgi:hypothetical protein
MGGENSLLYMNQMPIAIVNPHPGDIQNRYDFTCEKCKNENDDKAEGQQ